MPIFANRTIQAMLERLEPGIGAARSRELRGRLSSAVDGNERISAEWELAVFQCLAEVGELEFPDGASRSADTVFKSRGTGEQMQVEITAISDRGLHDKNPVEEFSCRLGRINHGLRDVAPGVIDYQIGYVEVDDRIVLGVPDRCGMDEFFRSPEFSGFLASIRANPKDARQFDFECRGSRSQLTFRPGAQYRSGGHIAHDVILDLQRNHVVSRLKKKDAQIRESGRELPSVLVLCDGDCRSMRSRLTGPGRPGFDDVVSVFLSGRPRQQAGPLILQERIPQGSRRINAVIVVAVREEHGLYGGVKRSFDVRPFMNGGDVRYPLSSGTVDSICSSFRFLPRISTSPINARRAYRYPPHYGGYMLGAGRTGRVKAKISLLTLQGLLAGEISHAEFARDHRDTGRVISKAVSEGKMISRIEIEHCPDEDDDWVNLEFNETAPDKLFATRRK